MASASRRNGSPGCHRSTSAFGGSWRLIPAYRLELSSLPDAFIVSKTAQYSLAVSPSSGCFNGSPLLDIAVAKRKIAAAVDWPAKRITFGPPRKSRVLLLTFYNVL